MAKIVRAATMLAAGAALMLAPAVASAAPAEAPVKAAASTDFYCAAATGPTLCTPNYIANAATGHIYLSVNNHANGGERCRLFINGIGTTPWKYINAGDNSVHQMTTGVVSAGVGYNVTCQRRAASGDAGIGGWVY